MTENNAGNVEAPAGGTGGSGRKPRRKGGWPTTATRIPPPDENPTAPKVKPANPDEIRLTYRTWLWIQHNGDTGYAPLARLVLGGGPDSMWMGKPLRAEQIVHDIQALVIEERNGFTPEMLKLAELAVEAYRKEHVTTKQAVADRKLTAAHQARSIDLLAREAGIGVVREVMGDLHEEGLDNGPVRSANAMMAMRLRCTFTFAQKVGKHEPGERCDRTALPGNTRCEFHGGNFIDDEETRALIKQSHATIVRASNTAVQVVIDIMQNSPNDQMRLKAAEMLLDRGGLTAGVNLTIESTGRDELAGVGKSAADQLREKLMRLALPTADEVAQEANPAYVEGELVTQEGEVDSGPEDDQQTA